MDIRVLSIGLNGGKLSNIINDQVIFSKLRLPHSPTTSLHLGRMLIHSGRQAMKFDVSATCWLRFYIRCIT